MRHLRRPQPAPNQREWGVRVASHREAAASQSRPRKRVQDQKDDARHEEPRQPLGRRGRGGLSEYTGRLLCCFCCAIDKSDVGTAGQQKGGLVEFDRPPRQRLAGHVLDSLTDRHRPPPVRLRCRVSGWTPTNRRSSTFDGAAGLRGSRCGSRIVDTPTTLRCS